MNEPTLSKQLAKLKEKLEDCVQRLESASRLQQRGILTMVKREMNEIWPQWDGIIKKVAEAEKLTYNVADVLAACGDEEDARFSDFERR